MAYTCVGVIYIKLVVLRAYTYAPKRTGLSSLKLLKLAAHMVLRCTVFGSVLSPLTKKVHREAMSLPISFSLQTNCGAGI